MSQPEQNQPTEIEKRKSAGKAGRLCTIEVFYEDIEIDPDMRQRRIARRWTHRNQYWSEVKAFRGMVYTHGLMVQVAPDHWTVIHPMEIKTVDIWQQSDYFKEF